MKNLFPLALTILLLMPASIVCADQDLPALSIITPVDESCSAGSALDQSNCLQKELSKEEAEMDVLVKEAVDTYTGFWGDGDIKENRQRIVETQEAWKKYRDGHCTFGYYKDASVHAPSIGLRMISCKKQKTEQRIEEIKKAYLSAKQ